MTEKDLLKLKRQLEKAKLEMAQQEGGLKNMLQTLKTDWDCETLEEAETLLKKMKRKKEKLDEQIAAGLEDMSDKFSQFNQDE